jgi:hypothetical protein
MLDNARDIRIEEHYSCAKLWRMVDPDRPDHQPTVGKRHDDGPQVSHFVFGRCGNDFT